MKGIRAEPTASPPRGTDLSLHKDQVLPQHRPKLYATQLNHGGMTAVAVLLVNVQMLKSLWV